ncbi:hypothetical protein LKK83_16350 [Phormidium sp. CCY1219]|nr:hypothetical protein [Phormidium sp. CCY1219]
MESGERLFSTALVHRHLSGGTGMVVGDAQCHTGDRRGRRINPGRVEKQPPPLLPCFVRDNALFTIAGIRQRNIRGENRSTEGEKRYQRVRSPESLANSS